MKYFKKDRRMKPKTLDTKKLTAAYKSDPSKPVHYQSYGGGAGYVCNGFMGTAVLDHDTWKKLMLQLGAEAEKGRIKLVEDMSLRETLTKLSGTTVDCLCETGVSVTKADRTCDLFEGRGYVVALDHKFVAALGSYTSAKGESPTGAVSFLGWDHWSIIMPVMPKAILNEISRAADLMRGMYK